MFLLAGCGVVRIQQPLPGSLWGNWSVERLGFEERTNIKEYPYVRACYNKDDLIHFSSDKKITFRWHDAYCGMQYYFAGRYQVDDRTLLVNLEDPPYSQHLPFPFFARYQIVEINETTLELRVTDEENAPPSGRSYEHREDFPRLIVLRKVRN